MRNKTVGQDKNNVYRVSWKSKTSSKGRAGDRGHGIGKRAQNTLSAFSSAQLSVFLR